MCFALAAQSYGQPRHATLARQVKSRGQEFLRLRSGQVRGTRPIFCVRSVLHTRELRVSDRAWDRRSVRPPSFLAELLRPRWEMRSLAHHRWAGPCALSPKTLLS